MRKYCSWGAGSGFLVIQNLLSCAPTSLKKPFPLNTSIWGFISVSFFCMGICFYLVSTLNRSTKCDCISNANLSVLLCLEFKNAATFLSAIEAWRCVGYNFCSPINRLSASILLSLIILYLSCLKCVPGWIGPPSQTEICNPKHSI